MSRNLGRLQDAEKYIKEALSYLDGMTEREKFATRAFYYRMTGDYQQCVKEYGELTARYRGRCDRPQQPRPVFVEIAAA